MPNPPAQPPRKINGGKEIAGVSTKWWVIGGGAAVVIVYYAYHRASASSAQAASTAGTTDPNATDPYAYDAYGGSYSTAGNSGASGGAVGVSPVGPPMPYDAAGNLMQPTTLAAWVTEAEAALLAMGYSPDAVSAALSAYASGAPLTPTQAGTVASAGGAVGAPPGTVTTAVPPPSTTPHHITVHSVLVGTKVPGQNRVKLAWTPVPYASGYHLWKDGGQVATFPKTQLSFTTALLAKGKHTWWIQAYNSVSHLGSNQIAITI